MFFPKKYFYIFGIFLAFLIGAIFTNFVVSVLAHGGDTSLIHACVRNNLPNLPNIRIVGANTNCGPNETALDWNIQGLPGNSSDLPPICTGCHFDTRSQLVDSFGTDLSNGIFSNSDFPDDNASGLNFTQARLEMTFGFGDLSNSNFTGARFNNAVMLGANLQNTNFTNADFTNADLRYTTNISTATLTGVIWSNTICPDETNSDNNGNTCIGHLTP